MKRAFTLVELLVISAIVVILATVLFPVLTRNQEASNSTCMRNLRTIGRAAFMYARDADDVVVPYLECSRRMPGCEGGPDRDAFRGWTARLLPYLNGHKAVKELDLYPPQGAFKCPDWSLQKVEKGADERTCDGNGSPQSGLARLVNLARGLNDRQMLLSTYGFTFDMCSPGEAAAGRLECSLNGGGAPSGNDYGRDGKTVGLAVFAYAGSKLYPLHRGLNRRFSEIVRPRETALAGDGGFWLMQANVAASPFIDLFGCEGRYVHGSSANFLMADGHSMRVAGMAESYRIIGPDSLWIERYFTFYE